MTGFSAITAIASFGFQIASGIQQSRAAQAQAAFQAALARNNAIIAQRHAEDARLRGEQELAQIRIREGADAATAALATRQFIARQRVAQASLGQTVDESPLTADTAAAGKLDELTLRRNARFEREVARNNAEREAIGFLTQGFNFEAEARLADLRRSSARNAGIISAFGTIITTAGTVHEKFTLRKLALEQGRIPTLVGFV